MNKQIEEVTSDLTIRAQPNPVCIICGTEGERLYQGMQDRMGNAPGTWDSKRCKNPECGLIWLDPLPVEDDIINAYQSYYTHQSGELIWKENYARTLYIKLKYGYEVDKLTIPQTIMGLIKLLNVTRYAWYDHSVLHLSSLSQGKLLEIGFGNGDALVELNRLGWTTEGIDFDLAAVEVARQKGLNVAHGGLQEQHYPDNYFDAIVMSHVIEHVYKPEWVIEECLRILKPRGKLILLTPNNQSLTHQFFEDACFAIDPPRHLNFFNSASLKRLLVQANFTTVNAYTISRNARSFFLNSLAIQKTGHYRFVGKPSFVSRLTAIVFHLKEILYLRFNKSVGEELVIIGTK